MLIVSERANRTAFPASHYLSFLTADGRIVVFLTGIACVEWSPSSPTPGWQHDEIEIAPTFAPGACPLDKAFALEQWTVFACPTAELGGGFGGAAGWAVDKFDLVTRTPVTHYGEGSPVPFRCQVAVQGGGWLHRIAYSLTLTGRLVENPTN